MRVQLSVTYPVDHPGNMNHPHMVVVASQDPMTAPVGAENNGSGTDDEQARVTKDATEQDAPGPKLVTPSLDEPPT
jgi:hypothetical protein